MWLLVCVALPQGAMGWSEVCDCGISRSYSLFQANLSQTVRLFVFAHKVEQQLLGML